MAENAIAVPAAKMQEILNLDNASKSIATKVQEARAEKNEILIAMYTARGLVELKKHLTPSIMQDFMMLQGSIHGFRTDKDRDGGYSIDVVREVFISSLMSGLRPTGNEFNIIAGNLYVTKEGYSRLLKELPGFTRLSVNIGVPANVDGGALVPAKASWRWHGKPDSLECFKTELGDFRLPIKVNKGMGADAILGKAESKLLRRIYKRVVGSAIDTDPDEQEVTPEPPEAAEPTAAS